MLAIDVLLLLVWPAILAPPLPKKNEEGRKLILGASAEGRSLLTCLMFS